MFPQVIVVLRKGFIVVPAPPFLPDVITDCQQQLVALHGIYNPLRLTRG